MSHKKARKKQNLRGRKGFTLMEVLIVIVILGVLAGLAVPMYQASVEKSRKAEALATLGALRQSEIRYFATSGSYTATLGQLDFDPNATAGGQTIHFTYAVAVTGGGTGFTATATRNAVDGGDGTSTVTINQAGTVGGTGVFQ